VKNSCYLIETLIVYPLQALNGFLVMLTCDGEVFFATHTIENYLGFHQVNKSIIKQLNTLIDFPQIYTIVHFIS